MAKPEIKTFWQLRIQTETSAELRKLKLAKPVSYCATTDLTIDRMV